MFGKTVSSKNMKSAGYPKITADITKATINAKLTPTFIEYHGTERKAKNALQKTYKEEIEKVNKVASAGILTKATVAVTWKSVRGHSDNPTAEVEYFYLGASGELYNRTEASLHGASGGYDKESFAIAKAFNQIPEFLRILFDAREKGKEIPYGAELNKSRPYCPRYMQGVGASSLMGILRASGYDVIAENYAGNVFIYRITKSKNKKG